MLVFSHRPSGTETSSSPLDADGANTAAGLAAARIGVGASAAMMDIPKKKVLVRIVCILPIGARNPCFAARLALLH